MRRKNILIALIGVGVMAGATATDASNVRYYNGRIICRSVNCLYEVTGTQGGGAATTGTCGASDVREAFLFCRNPANNSVKGSRHGQAFSQIVTFETGLSQGVNSTTKQRGRSRYDAVANAEGLAESPEECDASDACNALRTFCTNPEWVPVSVVPISFCAVQNVWECASADPSDCPCDPTGVEGGPLCQDHDLNTPGIQPMMAQDKVLFCQMPDPETFRFGDERTADCRDATPAECPSLFQ
jgi:hypothetical protein